MSWNSTFSIKFANDNDHPFADRSPTFEKNKYTAHFFGEKVAQGSKKARHVMTKIEAKT